MRLRRRTLGTLIGGAFAAGAAVAVALPWLQSTFGPNAMLVLAAAGRARGTGDRHRRLAGTPGLAAVTAQVLDRSGASNCWNCSSMKRSA